MKQGDQGIPMYIDRTAVSMKVAEWEMASISAEPARLRIVKVVPFSCPEFFHRAAVSWPSYQMSMALIGTQSF